MRVDDHEKKAYRLVFPEVIAWWDGERKHSIKVETRYPDHLVTGDYAIEGFERVTLLETKRSMRELFNNYFTNDHRRSNNAISRLAIECEYPYLCLDFTILEAMAPSHYVKDPQKVLDTMYQDVAGKGIRLVWMSCGSSPNLRSFVGKQMLHLMWSHCWKPQ